MQGVHLLPRGYSIIMACKGEVSLERGTFYRLQVYDSMFTDGSIFSSKSVERVTKSKKPRRIYWPPAESCRQCKEVRVGEEENRRSLFFSLALRARSRALASLVDVFEKNEEKNKTTSIYRLMGERLDKFNLFFPQRCLQTFFIIIIFFLTLHARRCFEKSEEKNETTAVYRRGIRKDIVCYTAVLSVLTQYSSPQKEICITHKKRLYSRL